MAHRCWVTVSLSLKLKWCFYCHFSNGFDFSSLSFFSITKFQLFGRFIKTHLHIFFFSRCLWDPYLLTFLSYIMHPGMILIWLLSQTEDFLCLFHQSLIDVGIYLFYLLNDILKVIFIPLLIFQNSKTLKSKNVSKLRILMFLWALKFTSQCKRNGVRKNAKAPNPF